MLHLLRLKNWQIFWLAAGLSLVARVTDYAMLYLLPAMYYNPMIGRFADAALLFCFVVRMFWLYAQASELYSKLVLDAELISLNAFKVVFIVHIIFRLFFMAFPILTPASGFEAFASFAMVAIFGLVVNLFTGAFIYYYISRALTSAEFKRTSNVQEYLGTFFLYVIYPVGIWWIQPRLNHVFGTERRYRADTPLDHDLN